MIIGQAALETGWGTSRFAVEGNNLFGIRTWNKDTPHMVPIGIKKWPGWGVRIFATKCDSVAEYVRLLNEHPAYADFRKLRESMLVNNYTLDPIALIKTLDKFSTTADYVFNITNFYIGH
jgi:Bax protein